MYRIYFNDVSNMNLKTEKWLRRQPHEYDVIIGQHVRDVVDYGKDKDSGEPYIDTESRVLLRKLREKFDITIYDKFLFIDCNRYAIKADGEDKATFTVFLRSTTEEHKRMSYDEIDQTIINYDGIEFASIKGYGAIEVEFIDGIAIIELTVPPEKSGKLTFGNQDSTRYCVIKPAVLWAVV